MAIVSLPVGSSGTAWAVENMQVLAGAEMMAMNIKTVLSLVCET